jgi:hypothetical protein
MSGISRRALFGLSVGAVAAKAMPAPELRAETYFTELDVGVDFGKHATTFYVLPGRTLKWQRDNPEKMAEYREKAGMK